MVDQPTDPHVAPIDTVPTAPDPDGWEWAIVEIFGHRKHAGRTRDVERFGVKMVRIDVPTDGAPEQHGWTTHLYAGSALFSFTQSDEATCLRLNKPYEAPARYRLPAPSEPEDIPELDGSCDDLLV